MGNPLAALTLVLCGLFTGDRMTQITIDPDPPKAGKSATITYVAGADIIIEYTPGGTIRRTCDANGKVDVTVPAGAQYMLIVDASNSSVSSGYTVTP
jgi:hypothetical protein